MLIGSGGSIIAAGVIFLFSYWYNRKRQSDAAANEYTQLTNNITNLNSKLDNLNIKIDNESEARKNQFNNINEKFDNGFERFFIEIDKLNRAISINANSINNLSEASKSNSSAIKTLNDEVPTVIQTKKPTKLRQVFSLKFYRCQIA
jgi:chromosome segregation ATPase